MKSLTYRSLLVVSVISAFALLTILPAGCSKQNSTGIQVMDTVRKTNITALPLLYTDVNPDTNLVKTGMLYNLDLNNDGVTDFTFVDGRLSCLGQNEVLLDSVFRKPEPLPINTTIGSASKTWYDSTAMILQTSAISGHGKCPCLDGSHAGGCGQCIFYRSVGPWAIVNDAYLGLRVHLGTLFYYGWAHITIGGIPRILTVGSSYKPYLRITIEEYCFNRNAGISLIAGQVK